MARYHQEVSFPIDRAFHGHTTTDLFYKVVSLAEAKDMFWTAEATLDKQKSVKQFRLTANIIVDIGRPGEWGTQLSVITT